MWSIRRQRQMASHLSHICFPTPLAIARNCFAMYYFAELAAVHYLTTNNEQYIVWFWFVFLILLFLEKTIIKHTTSLHSISGRFRFIIFRISFFIINRHLCHTVFNLSSFVSQAISLLFSFITIIRR